VGTNPGAARVRFGLQTAALSQSSIARVVLQVSGGLPAAGALTAELTRGQAPGTWEVVLLSVPAGTQRQFVATAYDTSGQLLYQGTTASDVPVGTEAQVVLILNQVTPGDPEGFGATLALDVPDSIVQASGTLALRLSATGADAGSSLTYVWSASCDGGQGDGSFTPASGVLAAPGSTSTAWVAPTVGGLSCTLGVAVTGSGALGGNTVRTYVAIRTQ
jgi:hypothetical protein